MNARTHATAIDIGYSRTKYPRIATGDVTMFPSVIGPRIALDFDVGIKTHEAGIAIGRWFVGAQAEAQCRPEDKLSPTARDRSGVYTTLACAAFSLIFDGSATDRAVNLVTGLPVDWYEDRAEIEDALAGVHEYTYNDTAQRITVENIRVIPQPAGTYYGSFIRPDGTVIPNKAKKSRFIIDIGRGTVDFALFDADMQYKKASSGSIPVACGKVYDAVASMVHDRYGVALGFYEAEQATITRTITLWGKTTKIDAIVEQAMEPVEIAIMEEAKSLVPVEEAKKLHEVTVTGGGAPAFIERIASDYKSARVVEGDPQVANLLGFLGFANLLQRRGW